MLLCQLLSLASEALELIIEFFIFAHSLPVYLLVIALSHTVGLSLTCGSSIAL